jgi:hypothetical protein
VKKSIFIFFLLLGLQARTQSNFPLSWLGSYEGDMYLEYLDGIKDTVPVTFDLLETGKPNRWTFKMTYNSKKWGTMVKDYEIFWNDSLKSPNLFLLDEKDGILIQEVFMNQRLFSHFEVEGGHFISLLERQGKNLYFEIRCTDPKQGLVSRSEKDAEGNSYQVSNYFQYTVQYVVLKPKKKGKK